MSSRVCLLSDGRLLDIRTVVPNDCAALAAFYRSVSPMSRRARFHGAAMPSDDYLRALVRLSRSGNGAAVAAADIASNRVVAVAECRIDPALPCLTADAAILVHDHYQGATLGSQLWDALVADARQAGIARLRVDMQAENRCMHRIIARQGVILDRRASGGHVRALIDIGRGSGSPVAGRPARDSEATP